MLGASPICPCLPPSVGSPASGAVRPPRTDVPLPSSGSWGSGSLSLMTAPRPHPSPPLCPLVRAQDLSQSTPGLRGHVLGTVIGSVGGDPVVVEGVVLVVVLGRLPVGIGLAGVLRALAGTGQLCVRVPGALERLLEFAR